MLDAGGEALVDVEHCGDGLGILALDQGAAEPARRARDQGARIQSGQAQRQPQPVGAGLGVALRLGEQPLLVHADEPHPVHRRGVLGRLHRGQLGGGALFAPERLQQQRQRLVTLFDGLGEILDGSRVLAEFGHGAVQPGLAVGDQAFVIGPDLERRLIARAEVERAREGGGRAEPEPERQHHHHDRGAGLPGGREHEAADLAAGTHIEMPFGKQPFERQAQRRQAIHIFWSPHRPGRDMKQSQSNRQGCWRGARTAAARVPRQTVRLS